MYRKVDPTPTPPSNFDLPFQGQLSENNRWVIMAKIIPWSEFEIEYAQNLVVLFCKGQRKTISLIMQSPFFF